MDSASPLAKVPLPSLSSCGERVWGDTLASMWITPSEAGTFSGNSLDQDVAVSDAASSTYR
ncbi:hypothetical protein [Mediterranea massiliensis]|uniref:hypothetical protein n=1 Tax=Mediterranea massiliensis TaxID=1841865 RepID=UPI001EF5C907|nr:hypothetical protein [Mediterranea massiliensis]